MMLLGSLTGLSAQDTFEASAPSKVVVGEQFRLSYTFKNIDHPKDFRIPELSDFDILMGPSTSTRMTIVNGQSDREVTYTYLLRAKSMGRFTIAPATATHKRKQLKSNELSIEVLPADKSASSSAGGHSSSGQSASSANASTLSSENLFVRAIPTKTKVYEQEGICLSYKLYTRVDVAGVDAFRFPEFKGFLAQEIELKDQQWDMENYNGLNYRTVLLKQTILYPQQSGRIEIEGGSFDLVVRVRNTSQRSRSIFDDFFDSYQDVRKTVASNPVTIQVEEFPFGKPASFHPFSGSLKMTVMPSATELKADEALTIKVIISGTGNMKMIKTPDLKFPADFDVYDPKVTNQFKTTANGVSGTKTIEYLAIPRYAGEFEIPGLQLSYFDLATKSYKTLSSEAFTLKVDKSANASAPVVSGNYTGKEDIRYLGQDIRYLKTGDFVIAPKQPSIYAAPWYPWAFALPVLLVGLVMWLYRKQLKANADLAAVRTRKANKVAVKRLKKASNYLKSHQKSAFYAEVLQALWGYTCDKLNLPLSQLNKDNVASQLIASGVAEQLCRDYLALVETCEFEQYAPGQGTQAMETVYANTLQLIDHLETSIKTKNHAKS